MLPLRRRIHAPSPTPGPTMPQRPLLRASLVVVAGTAVLVALAAYPGRHGTILVDAILDTGHVPAYASFAVLVWWAARSTGRARERTAYALAFLATLAVGAATELLQYFGPRNADVGDLMRDLAGAVAGLLVVAARRGASLGSRRARAAALVLALGIVVAALTPTGLVLRDLAARNRSFPVILAFESGHELRFVDLRDAWLLRTPLPDSLGRGSEGRAGLLTFLPSDLPALTVAEVVADWSGYDRLEFEATLPGSTGLVLSVRIDEVAHDGHYGDRYDGRFTLRPGTQRVVIDLQDIATAPRTRTMDLRRMRSLTFFVERPTERRRLYLDDVRLVGASDRHGP